MAGNEYPDRHLHPPHRHRRAQFLHAAVGTMSVQTSQGAWMVLPHEAIWIPPGVEHSIRMLGRVQTCSVYLDDEAAVGVPDRCQVLGVSPLLRQLLIEAVDLPGAYDPATRAGKIMSLVVDEIRQARPRQPSLPLPADERLAARCRRFIERPSAQETIDRWCADLPMSRRSFTRAFVRETGMTFAAWQRRACILAAIPRLLAGERVTTVAYDQEFSSPAVFSAVFRRIMGGTPTAVAAGLAGGAGRKV